jgi:quinohemoprotein amine dehydrogenase beta subunit
MRRLAMVGLLIWLVQGCHGNHGGHPPPRDYILTAAKPDHLFVVDAAARKVVADFRIPQTNGWLGTVVVPTDAKVAYVLVNRMETVAGIDLATGKQVFRADLSSAHERIKSIYTINVTPDGRWLIVYELPTRMDLDEYHVEEPRFAIFDTRSGLTARPVRQFPAPRRVQIVLPRMDSRAFYALGFQLYEYDIATGKLRGERGVRDWNRPNYSIPDIVSFFPASEPTNTWSTPVYSTLGAGAAAVPRTSLMTLDQVTGNLKFQDFEDTAAVMFSSVLSPRRGEAFAVFLQLSKIDTKKGALAGRVDLPHTFYTVSIATDGSEVFTGGAGCDIGFFDAQTLQLRTLLKLPGCPDQSNSTLRVIRR